jgi:DNA-binding transcriptional LysR family regulator
MSVDGLDPVLRRAYDEASGELGPSPFLQARGVLASGPRRSRRLHTAAVAAAAAVAGFALGIGIVSRTAPQPFSGTGGVAVAARSETPLESALEEVQRTGSEHARAIARLVEALDQVDAVMLGRAQEIYLAARRASEEHSEAFLAGAGAAVRRPPAPVSDTPLIWF